MICPELDPNGVGSPPKGPSPLQLLRLCGFAALRLCVSASLALFALWTRLAPLLALG